MNKGKQKEKMTMMKRTQDKYGAKVPEETPAKKESKQCDAKESLTELCLLETCLVVRSREFKWN